MKCTWAIWVFQVGYTFEDIGVLPGDLDSLTTDINQSPNRTQVTGSSGPSNSAVLWEEVTSAPSQLIDLDGFFGQKPPLGNAYGLNNAFPSTVVGIHDFGTGHPTPIVWQKTGRTRLPTFVSQGGAGEARSVNDSNFIAGWSANASSRRQACLWAPSGGVWQLQGLAGLGGKNSESRRINQAGVIAGSAEDATGAEHACRWDSVGVHDLHIGVGTSVGVGINIHGDVVGVSNPIPGTDQAMHWPAAGAPSQLAAIPGSTGATALSINDQGVIVGFMDGPQSAIAWVGTTVVRLQDQTMGLTAGWHLTRATSINNRGQICGFGTNPAGQMHGWVLDPVRVHIPHQVCFIEVPHVPSLTILGQIAVDGGGIVITPSGKVVHVDPPRGDPLQLGTNIRGLAALMDGRLATRSGSHRGIHVAAEIGALMAQVVERDTAKLVGAFGA